MNNQINNHYNFLYEKWFLTHQFITKNLNKVSLAAGAIWGMISLEGHTLIKCSYHTFFKYKMAPEKYGLNTFTQANKDKNPILLFHGAVGSCHYMTELAQDLKNQGRAVFVLNLGNGMSTEEKRERVLDEVRRIQKLYEETFDQRAPQVDFVAHSMGGYVALTSAFTKECLRVDANENLHMQGSPTIHSSIGKIVTIAIPTIEQELQWVKEAKKEDCLFNITAKYDALMGHKQCALDTKRQCEIDAGHVGIIFHKDLGHTVGKFLDRNSG